MTDFERALKNTLRYEGGFVNDPADPGGATNYGVTQAVYNAYRYSKKQQAQSVRYISNAEVRDIYKAQYWDTVTAGRIWPLNAVLFDAAVNSGPGNALWMLAQAKALHPEYDGLDNATRQHKLTDAVIAVRRRFFRAIVARRPASGKFLTGWLRRCDQLQQFCAQTVPFGFADFSDDLPQAIADDFTPRTHDVDVAELELPND